MRTKGEGIMTKQIDINRETIKKTIAEFERHEGTKLSNQYLFIELMTDEK